MDTHRLVEILSRCRKQDRQAQRELYQAFYRYGLSVCLRYIADVEIAREVLNDGFVKVFRQIDTFNPEWPFVNWFKKILINTALNQLRQQPPLILTELAEAEQVEVEMDLFGRFTTEEVSRLIQHLPPAYRTVFNLYVIEGYDHKEIAQMLGISVGTSLSNLSRARQKLQELLCDF
ncbi:RNA polymerase sigma factor [Larkinella terrae]|uniref:Sigma-70 family RNA polymerase sigma factor n=1 Tax=Larkinella terrae TaxID=2025311 RepID=A0A7K0ETD5_9BACT|nr:RNA polymerase sigma factor [Larkinella terrae]MRS64806.1 sigma-70 family RNA polymerase sigma factor [Larkinella terrae]